MHFEVDLFWAWYGHHDPAQLVTFAQDRISQFHVKDMVLSATPVFSFLKDYTFTDPGEGIIDFGRIFAAKTASPRKTEYIIERDARRGGRHDHGTGRLQLPEEHPVLTLQR